MTAKKDGKRIQITLTQKIFEQLEKHSERLGISRSALISIAIEEKFAKENENKQN